MARTNAENLREETHNVIPDLTTTNTSVNQRGNKLYIDPSQNDYADRFAVAYCARAFDRPTVSAPLEWEEVNTKLDLGKFNIYTNARAIEKERRSI